ncbi:MAG TPA: 2-C-methyl-D-erythritol 4-phosphate cytidylyltransferase [Acidimicrobiales bacterium]|nr:2-C-methyl-D-erythritol 4-phosphate cytidylyltransferase [Acidimicrobiales bacterium]
MNDATVWTVVVAGGSGARFGAAKQFEQLGDRRVVDWALEAAQTASTGVVLVVPPDRVVTGEPLADVVVAGGATRSASVRAGLAAVPPEADVVLVHDAARPLAPVALFEAVVAAVADDGADAAVPGVAVSDTIKRVAPGGAVVETVDRTSLVAVQTPQAFRAAALRAAHEREPEATDDAALIEAAGGRVVVVDGDARAMKVTTREDLKFARALVGDD